MSNKDLCAYHNEIEPITDTTYKVCGECLHAWQTVEEFMEDCRKDANFMNASSQKWLNDPFSVKVMTAADCFESGICPLCTHDF